MISGSVLTLINTLVGLIAFPVYLNYLGVEEYGVWLLLAVILNISRLGMLGVPEAITKLISEYEAQQNILIQERIISTALIILLGMGLFVVIVTLVLMESIIGILGLSQDNSVTASVYLPYIAILSAYIFISETVNSVLSGLGRMDKANYIKSLSGLFAMATSFLLLYWGLGLESLIVGSTVGFLYLHAASAISIGRIKSIKLFSFMNWSKGEVAKILSFGGGVSGMSLLTMFLSPFNKVILSRYVNIEAVVVYEIGYRIASQLRSFYHMFFKALLPEVSKESAKNTKEAGLRIGNIKKNSIGLILIVGLPPYLILFLLSEPLLKLWLGGGYIESMTDVTKIFLVSSFFILLSVPSYFTFLGVGKVKQGLVAALIHAIVNLGIIFSCLWIGVPLDVYIVVFSTALGMALGAIYLIVQGMKNKLGFAD